MRLSWNEIRARAASVARKWADAGYEKGETQSFYDDFFRIFGVRRESVARYEEPVKKLDDTSGFIDLFWPGVLIVEQKSATPRAGGEKDVPGPAGAKLATSWPSPPSLERSCRVGEPRNSSRSAPSAPQLPDPTRRLSRKTRVRKSRCLPTA